MDKVLQRILDKKEELGITDVKMQKDLGIYASAFSEWRSGRSKSYSKYISQIADYLGVSADYLLGTDTIKVVDEERNIIVLDDDTLEIIRSLRERPEMKMVFSTMKKATKEDIIQAVKIIEALKDND